MRSWISLSVRNGSEIDCCFNLLECGTEWIIITKESFSARCHSAAAFQIPRLPLCPLMWSAVPGSPPCALSSGPSILIVSNSFDRHDADGAI